MTAKPRGFLNNTLRCLHVLIFFQIHLTMYSEYSLKDVVRCHLCENPVPPLYCDICDKYLCKACDEKHLSNESIEHKVVPFNRRRSTRKCQNHSSKMCTFFCEQCDCYMCEQCASSEDHKRHKFYSTSDRPSLMYHKSSQI